jgi:hypothetical protein
VLRITIYTMLIDRQYDHVGIGKLSGNFMLLDQVRCPPAVSRRLGLLAVSANV